VKTSIKKKNYGKKAKNGTLLGVACSILPMLNVKEASQ
jgi:hypothetical protein